MAARRVPRFLALVHAAMDAGDRPRITVATTTASPNLRLSRHVAALTEGCEWSFQPSAQRWTTLCGRGRPLPSAGSSMMPKSGPSSSPGRWPRRRSAPHHQPGGEYKEPAWPSTRVHASTPSRPAGQLILERRAGRVHFCPNEQPPVGRLPGLRPAQLFELQIFEKKKKPSTARLKPALSLLSPRENALIQPINVILHHRILNQLDKYKTWQENTYTFIDSLPRPRTYKNILDLENHPPPDPIYMYHD